MNNSIQFFEYALMAAFVLGNAPTVQAQTPLPSRPLEATVSIDQKEFIARENMLRQWEVPAEPVRIVGPLYFVGTVGLGVFLFTTTEGHVLLNTGMPSSGPMILDSVRKLGFKPEDIKIMINGHAHADHAGAFAYLKQQLRAELAVMKDEVPTIESGGRDDFLYADVFRFPPVKVDRVLRNGDTIKLGDILLTAYHTPGHTRGSTTWIANLAVDGKSYVVAFPDGAGFNPGYRVAKDPSYPGIGDDYRNTHHFLEMLKPDIWLAQHNSWYDLEGKRKRSEIEGASAWIDPEGYRRFIASRKRRFEDQVDKEIGALSTSP
jgi:metallo-beta-lactamase class B